MQNLEFDSLGFSSYTITKSLSSSSFTSSFSTFTFLSSFSFLIVLAVLPILNNSLAVSICCLPPLLREFYNTSPLTMMLSIMQIQTDRRYLYVCIHKHKHTLIYFHVKGVSIYYFTQYQNNYFLKCFFLIYEKNLFSLDVRI